MKKVISGGQCGADIAALIAAKKFGIETGGWAPNGFITQYGKKPEYADLYNLKEHPSPKYPPRTYANAKESDGTIRFAGDFNSSGEKCTLKAINQYNKPYLDVDLLSMKSYEDEVEKIIEWINKHRIEVLNIAGNSEKTFQGTAAETQEILELLFAKLGIAKVMDVGS